MEFTSHQLEVLHEETTRLAQELGMAVFPAWPERRPNVIWPGDPSELVRLAAQVSSRVVYVDLERHGVGALDWEEMFEDLEDEEENEIWQLFNKHLGEAFQLRVGFSFDGVVHLWSHEAAWMSELQDQITELLDVRDAEEQEHQMSALQQKIPEWVEVAAAHMPLRKASEVASVRMIRQLLPEIPNHSIAEEVASKAQASMDAFLAPQVRHARDGGEPINTVCTRFGITRSRFDRYMLEASPRSNDQ